MMILPNKKDAVHKAWLYRILSEIADNTYLANVLYFKGGTMASMQGWLDRFSVDLDFDYAGNEIDVEKTRESLEKVFKNLGLNIKDQSKNGIQYFLKYENPNDSQSRSVIKIDVYYPLFSKSKYKALRFVEIDRILKCQTREVMFAHKLVAIVDRFKKTTNIAGRDIYDIHYFFLNGYSYDSDVIEERTGKSAKEFLQELVYFIEKEVTEKVLTEDLSSLLPYEKFVFIRKILKIETINLLKDQIKTL